MCLLTLVALIGLGVFKWGSLIGISIPDSGANGSSPFVAGDVVFRPREFTTAITTWATVPYCTTDFAPYNNTATDHLVTIHNPATGVGDICRYMGVVDGATWRMPTAAEIAELYGSNQINGGEAAVLPNDGSGWVLGSFHPLSGRAFGPHQSIVTIVSDTQVDNADPNTCGAVFLPASGHRTYTNGAIVCIGETGYYWSSTGSTGTNGYYMSFNSSSVWPQANASRAYVFPIRCIRE